MVTGAGVLAAALVLARTRSPFLAVSVLLDLFAAAGPIRLTGPPSARRTAAAALVIVVRHVAGYGLALSRRSSSGTVARPR